MPKKLTQEEFINRAKTAHGDRYDYSFTIYIDLRTKVKIICKHHGVFEQRADYHSIGGGCVKCASYCITHIKTKETINCDLL